MNEKFNRCIHIILESEGGFVDDPDDRGGATNMGISLRFLKGTGDIDFDLDHDGDIDVDDIKRMNDHFAAIAYKKYFWDPLQLDQLHNESLCLQVFDHAVNAGTRNAVKMLQAVAGCKQDGLIGPKTIASANTFSENIAERYYKERIDFYTKLAREKPVFGKFLRGWINRCNRTKNV